MKKPMITVKLLAPIGLLIMSMAILLHALIGLPDFIRGFMISFGACLAIAGFIKQKKNQKNASRENTPNKV